MGGNDPTSNVDKQYLFTTDFLYVHGFRDLNRGFNGRRGIISHAVKEFKYLSMTTFSR
ncbi:MAG TPA: hypothetical protein VH481_06625 [Nitrososphaeraceae archaeon]